MTLTPTELSGLAPRIVPTEDAWLQAGRARQDDLTKPPGSLGELEVIGMRLCGIAAQYPPPVPSNPKVIVFAADHGVYAQGVTPWSQKVSVQMAAGIAIGFAGVYVISRAFRARTEMFDVGLLQHAEGIVDRCIVAGTAGFTQEPAMTVKQAPEAIGVGIETANAAIDSGVDVLVPGETGLANTTLAAALTAAPTGRSVAEVTDRRVGADDEMLAHRVAVTEEGLEVGGVARLATEGDTVGALAAVDGFGHAAMAGLIPVAATRRAPVVLDGVVSCSATLVARTICPDVVGYPIAGHAGVEPAITATHEALGLRGLVDLGLRLGEGSDGALVLPLARAAALIINEMDTFSGQRVSKTRRASR